MHGGSSHPAGYTLDCVNLGCFAAAPHSQTARFGSPSDENTSPREAIPAIMVLENASLPPWLLLRPRRHCSPHCGCSSAGPFPCPLSFLAPPSPPPAPSRSSHRSSSASEAARPRLSAYSTGRQRWRIGHAWSTTCRQRWRRRPTWYSSAD